MDSKNKRNIFLILQIIFSVLTFIGAILVIMKRVDNAGYAVIPMLFSLIFGGFMRESQRKIKEIVFKIKHCNWGMIGPGDWTDVEWEIYNDLTVDIKRSYKTIELDNDIKISNRKLTKNDYNNIFKNIQLSKENSVIVEACDGSAWEIIQYENGNEVWKRDLGYIYGIKPLEDIAEIVNKLVE